AEDPVVELRLVRENAPGVKDSAADVPKVKTQGQRLQNIMLDNPENDPFGPALDWASRCYKVVNPSDGKVLRDHLYLFNVLVAFEWQPGSEELEQLRRAFRRASDFLFDVTDGWMAFGQVVFGGSELMSAADIQIMASNRILSRSWVGGMLTHEEY